MPVDCFCMMQNYNDLMIVLFSDYGDKGPYIGQVKAALLQVNPGARIVNLTANAPRNNPVASAYMLASYATDFMPGSIFFCVVDPGVGSSRDIPVIVEADGRTFVGPDNGLFDIIIRRSARATVEEITWRPGILSNSFHGRDLYAPVCSMLSIGEKPESRPLDWKDGREYPAELDEIIFIDHFGNCISGRRACTLEGRPRIQLPGREVSAATTFSDVNAGEAFWYENANGLVEIAVNQGDASSVLELHIGSKISIN